VSLFGGGWFAHHAMNAALHAVNAIAVFCFILMMLRSGAEAQSRPRQAVLAAFFAALIWAVHPQRAEVVCWIASRKEELWTLFALLAMMTWVRRRFAAGCCFTVLACLSKPAAVALVPLLFLLEMCHPGFRQEGDAALQKGFFASLFTVARRIVPRYALLSLFAIVTGLIALVSQTSPEGLAPVPLAPVPLHERAFRFLCASGAYLGQALAPFGLHFDYIETAPAFAAVAVAVCCMLVLLAGRQALFALLFMLIALLPVSGLFGGFGEHARADRFFYFPSVGLALLVARLMMRIRSPKILSAVAGAFALACAVLSWPLVSSYRNDFTAFSRALAIDDCHWRALQHVGSEYCARLGRMDEGLEMLRRSYAISKRDSTAEVLAYALACRGDTGDAPEIRALCSKIEARPAADRRGMMAEALAAVCMWEEKWDDAERLLRASIKAPERFYSATEATFRLARTLSAKGDEQGARALLRQMAISEERPVRIRALQALEELGG